MASVGTSGKGIPLHTKILLALVVGAILGVSANLTLGGTHPFVEGVNRYVAGPVGQIFLRMLFMIVLPLVFASIALGVAGFGDLGRVGRVGGKTIAFFFGTTGIAAATGLLLVYLVRPGTRLDEAVREDLLRMTTAGSAQPVAATSFGVETIINIVPRNPVAAAANMDLLAVIFFALVFGAALTMIAAERARPMISVLEALNDIVIKIVGFAMRLAPYGVAGLIFGMTSRFGFALLAPLGRYVGVVIGALLFHAIVTNSLILRYLIGVSPVKFYGRIRAAIVTAFSTSSSGATLPTNIAVAEQNLGTPPKIAGFVLPLGATMCMNGTAIFEAITIIFLCQVFGVTLDLGQQIIVVIMSVITAIGAAGVPGGSIPLLVGILAMFRVPPEAIAIVLGVDRILDMSRTTLNVIGDQIAAAWVGKSEGVWTPAMIPAVPGLGRALDETPENVPLTSDAALPRGADQPRAGSISSPK